jgi:dienelactone hydrolase
VFTPPQDQDAGPPPVRALYEPGPQPMPFGAVPWPDDAYLDDRGRVRVSDLPSQASEEYATALAEAMADLDGFGVRPTIYFSFDGALDPASFPATAEATLMPDASVFLVDADTSSPEAFERIALDVHYDAASRQLRLRPAFWRSLVPGRLYAAVVTRAVRSEDGRAVAASERFLSIRDAQAALAHPLDRIARARYSPVLETLADQGVPRKDVVALAVFRVQSVRSDLGDARTIVRQTPPGAPVVTEAIAAVDLDAVLGMPAAGTVGLDAGAPHEHIGWMVHGRFESPNFLSAQAGVHGVFERGGARELRVKSLQDVPFTLWLPRGLSSGGAMPVVIVQHGLARERGDALALANELASSGYAVVAADAPFHGLRSGQGDSAGRFTGEDVPDGFGDGPGDFEGRAETEGELVPLHPFYYRDAVRQGTVDLMQLVHVLQEGDWSALRDLSPELEQIELDGAGMGFVGIGLGADMGVLLSSVEPDLGAVVLGFPNGSTVDSWLHSPARASLLDALWTRLGIEPDDRGDPAELLLLPDVDAWRALADRANSAAYAPALRRMPVNVLTLVARDDEVAHNSGTEALAHALNAVIVGGDAEYVPQLGTDTLRPGATLSANRDVEGGAVTRALYVLEPATHAALTHAQDSVNYRQPLVAPLSPLDRASTIDNPIDATLMQVAFFFESYRACRSATPAALCAASVMAPVAR